jgi:hypothetical protein
VAFLPNHQISKIQHAFPSRHSLPASTYNLILITYKSLQGAIQCS